MKALLDDSVIAEAPREELVRIEGDRVVPDVSGHMAFSKGVRVVD